MKTKITIMLLAVISALSLTTMVLAQDAGINEIVSPAPGTALVPGNSYTVSVVIKNYGGTTLTSIPVQFQIGTNIVTDTYTGSLASGDTIVFTFSSQLTISSTSSTFGSAATTLSGDVNIFNDATIGTYSFVTGITETGVQEFSVTTYPNPSTGLVNLVFISEAIAQEALVSVYDINGSQIGPRNGMTNSHNGMIELDLGKYPEGAYLVRTLIEGIVVTNRVVILR